MIRRPRRQYRDPGEASTLLPQSDLGRFDPPRVQPHRPVKRWEERQDEGLANQTALLNAWQQMSESLGGLLVLTRANAPGDAIGTGTQTIAPAGSNQRGFPANFQSVAITNFSSAPMTLTAAPSQSQAPTVGPGVYVVPPGCYRVLPLRGAVVTVYGTPGAVYDLTTYSKPRPMDFAAIGSPTPTLVQVGNPGAGVPFTYTPTAPFDIVAVDYLLTTSATVANRFAGVQIGPAAGGGAVYSVGTAQINGLTNNYSFFPGAAETALTAPIPGGPFPAGTAISSVVSGFQAGDTVTAIDLYLILL